VEIQDESFDRKCPSKSDMHRANFSEVNLALMKPNYSVMSKEMKLATL
jgi:hypothetical protein